MKKTSYVSSDSLDKCTVALTRMRDYKTYTYTEAARALTILPAMFTKREDLPASLYCVLVSVDPYHAPLGNAGLCKCLQITIFLK